MLLTPAKGRVAWELEWVVHPPVPSSAEFWSDPQQCDNSRLARDTGHTALPASATGSCTDSLFMLMGERASWNRGLWVPRRPGAGTAQNFV